MTVTSILQAWVPFYSVIASAAAALTGLMFVVLTLVATLDRAASRDGIAIYSTPTVVHYAVVLFLSAVLCAPWRTFAGPAIVLAVAGLGGMLYETVLAVAARKLSAYDPDAEDWVWYSVLPLAGYGMIVVAAALLFTGRELALYTSAAGAILLVVVGIHNAWDIVTYLALPRNGEK